MKHLIFISRMYASLQERKNNCLNMPFYFSFEFHFINLMSEKVVFYLTVRNSTKPKHWFVVAAYERKKIKNSVFLTKPSSLKNYHSLSILSTFGPIHFLLNSNFIKWNKKFAAENCGELRWKVLDERYQYLLQCLTSPYCVLNWPNLFPY